MSSRFWRPEIYLARVVLPFVACNRCRKTQSAYLRGIIKSAREEWPRNPPGNGKMAITSFYVTRILDHSRPQRFTRFSTPPIFATRFPPFAFNSFSRLRMHKQKRSLTIQQIVDDYTDRFNILGMRRLSELHAAESIFHTNFTAKKIDGLIELVPRSLGTRVPKSFRGSECELNVP